MSCDMQMTCATSLTGRSLSEKGEVQKQHTSGSTNQPEGESQRGKSPVGKAVRARRRLWHGAARPARYGESYTARTIVSSDASVHPRKTAYTAKPPFSCNKFFDAPTLLA